MKPSWDDNGVHTQAMILAFDQTCEHDDDRENANLMKAGVGRLR